MIRACKLALSWPTATKRQRYQELIVEWRRVVQTYIHQTWEAKSLSKSTHCLAAELHRVDSWLTARAKKLCMMQALGIVKARRKQRCSEIPDTRRLRPQLGETVCFVSFESDTTFSCWLTLRCFDSRTRDVKLQVPFRLEKHKHFKRLRQKGTVRPAPVLGWNQVSLPFEIPDPLPRTGRVLGIDVGLKRLAITSDGDLLGAELPDLIQAVLRKQHGSRRQRRARRRLVDYTRCAAKKLASKRVSRVVVEDLRTIQKGTKGRLSKALRRKLGAWHRGTFAASLASKCEENGIQFDRVPARYTSQRCNICGHIERGNRKGDNFQCLACKHKDHADINAALNIRDLGLDLWSAPLRSKAKRKKSAPVEKASSGPRSRGKRASGARLGPTVPRTKNKLGDINVS